MKKPIWPWLFTILFFVMLLGSYFLPKSSGEAQAKLELVSAQDNNNATVLSQPKSLQPLNLIDHNQQAFTLDQLKGHWSFLFFGYTDCPDVCPNEMAKLKQVADKIATNATPDTPIPKVLLVSIDPENDTPEKLKAYLKHFSAKFIGVTGQSDEIKRFAKELGIYHQKVEKPASQTQTADHSNHTMDASDQSDHSNHDMQASSTSHANHQSAMLEINHTASYILINPKGEFQAIFSPPHDATNIAASYTKITGR